MDAYRHTIWIEKLWHHVSNARKKMFADKIDMTMEVCNNDLLIKSLRVENNLKHLQEAFKVQK